MLRYFPPITLKKYKCLNTQTASTVAEEMDEQSAGLKKIAKTQWAASFQQGHARRADSSNCFLERFSW